MNGIILALNMNGGADGDAGIDYACSDRLDCLPVLRWASHAGTLISRSDGLIPDFLGNIPTSLVGMLVGGGNGMWGTAAWLANAGESDKALDAFGSFVDRFTGAFHRLAFLDSFLGWLVGIPMLIALCLDLWGRWARSGARSGELARRFGALTVSVCLLFAMGSGATATGDGSTPGFMSPWWMARTAVNATSDAADHINEVIRDVKEDVGLGLASDKTENLLSCRRYLNALDNGSAVSGKANDYAGALNSMWEETGLRIWIRSTFGEGSGGTDVFCRALESRVGATAEEMASITRQGMNQADKGNGNNRTLDWKAPAWWPNLADIPGSGGFKWPWDNDDANSDTGEGTATSKQLDRILTVFDVCGMKESGKIYVKPGFNFPQAIKGSSRTDAGTRDRDDRHKGADGPTGLTLASCQAMLTGYDWDDDSGDYFIVDEKGDIITSDDKGKEIANLTQLFDLNTKNTDLNATITAHGGGELKDRLAAAQLIRAQHGDASVADILPAFMFLLSGLVALFLWGAVGGLARIVAYGMVSVLAMSLYLALFILAVAPDKGRQAVRGSLAKMCGMVVGPTLISAVLSLGSALIVCTYAALNAIGADGSSSGGLGALCAVALFAPIGYLMFIRWLCMSVWRIGDPLSWPGLSQMMGFGKMMGDGLKTVAGGIAGGVGALVGGAGVMGALGAGLNAAGHGRGVFASFMGGRRDGQWEKWREGRTGQGGAPGTGPASEADRAAGDKAAEENGASDTAPKPDGFDPGIDPSSGERYTFTQGEYETMRARRRRILRAEARRKGLHGAEARNYVEHAMHSADVDAAIRQDAQALHDTPGMGGVFDAARQAAGGDDYEIAPFRSKTLDKVSAKAAKVTQAAADSKGGQAVRGVVAGAADLAHEAIPAAQEGMAPLLGVPAQMGAALAGVPGLAGDAAAGLGRVIADSPFGRTLAPITAPVAAAAGALAPKAAHAAATGVGAAAQATARFAAAHPKTTAVAGAIAATAIAPVGLPALIAGGVAGRMASGMAAPEARRAAADRARAAFTPVAHAADRAEAVVHAATVPVAAAFGEAATAAHKARAEALNRKGGGAAERVTPTTFDAARTLDMPDMGWNTEDMDARDTEVLGDDWRKWADDHAGA